MDTPPITTPPITIKSVAGVATISSDPASSLAFFRGLGIPFTADDDGYNYTTELADLKHFGIWPLADAALSCFGTTEWPDDHPVPQATIEFEVSDVEDAVQSLLAAGYTLLHGTRLEEWGQTTARLQSPEGLLVGVVVTPAPATVPQ
jgi:catechol 2,3-dioxygenase-like lactoylglutathione lyase family enzyme